jgi:hypothetical protein
MILSAWKAESSKTIVISVASRKHWASNELDKNNCYRVIQLSGFSPVPLVMLRVNASTAK